MSIAATRIGFNNKGNYDETQFEEVNFAELFKLWIEFCEEQKISPDCIESSYEVEIVEEGDDDE